MTVPELAERASSLHAGRRQRDLAALAAGEPVDVLVVGGGITGAGVALDAAARGLSVALVERRDLAHGTSRWSSKLVHGGLRYLASGDLALAYESAVERGRLMEHIAPHLVRALPMVSPIGAGSDATQAAMTGAGVLAGNALRVAAGTRRATLSPPRLVGPARARRLVPALRRDGLHGALVHRDGQLTDDAALVVAVARTAASLGARVCTYAEATEVHGDGARVRDARTGDELEIRARCVVNATGVWADRLHPQVRLRPSKGAHLVLDAAALGRPRGALTVPVAGQRSRFVFALPVDGDRVLLGLTDEPAREVVDEPEVTDEDVAFLLDALEPALDRPLRPAVLGAFAGLRPLLADGDGPTADLSRTHRVLVRDDGLTTVVGGKLTTYRHMAEQALDAALAARGLVGGPCRTRRLPLVGAVAPEAMARRAPVPLVRRYGAEADAVLRLQAREPDPPWAALRAAWRFALAHEGAVCAEDLVDRRSRVGLVPVDRERALPIARALVDEVAGP